jgi:hypothetical protein
MIDPVEPFVPRMAFPPRVKEAVQQAYRSAKAIGEYGAGGSTVFAAEHSKAPIRSVESDKNWVNGLDTYLAEHGFDRPGVEICWCDIGPTKEWGAPARMMAWSRFCNYPLALWREPNFSPDVVLIDGRFRLACFAATLLMCREPVRVLFDDYVGRPSYHRAEKLWPKSETIDRMAVFEVEPHRYENADFAGMLPWFFSYE